MTKRRHRAERRGFALLFIVMIVAVVAVAAAALLDIVEVDLLIAGEARRSVLAESIAIGGVKELQADDQKADLLPTATSPGLSVRYTGIDTATGQFRRDPDSVVGPSTVLDEDSSAFVRDNTAGVSMQRQGYEAQIRLVRVAPLLDSSTQRVKAIIFEVTSEGSVGNGGATSRVIAETFIFGSVPQGTFGQLHAR